MPENVPELALEASGGETVELSEFVSLDDAELLLKAKFEQFCHGGFRGGVKTCLPI